MGVPSQTGLFGRPVNVVVDADVAQGALSRIWASVGFDEINWTYTPQGKTLLRTLGSLGDGPYLVRSHYMFNSGTGMGLPHWGAGNIYHQGPDGAAYYDFQILDQVYDTVVGSGNIPIVELGFTPRDLVPDNPEQRFAFQSGSPTQYSGYEAAWWSLPPKSYTRWADLIGATVTHCLERYGEGQVSTWYWELWNEPDIGYWRGTVEEFCELYRVTVQAIRAVAPSALVGGPATTGDLVAVAESGLAAEGPQFLARFLDFCEQSAVPIDFVSFHTKGVYFQPWRSYLPLGSESTKPQSPSTTKMLREVRAALAEVHSRPALSHVQCLADECDASVPAHLGRFDNANFEYRNSEYFAVFQCKLMKKLLDLDEITGARLRAATAWAFYIEGERCFEGTRSLVTRGIDKPVLNAYRMLARLGRLRLEASSDAAWSVTSLDNTEALGEEVDVLAARSDDGALSALIWRHDDDQHRRDPKQRSITVRWRGLRDERYLLRHLRIDAEHSNSHSAWKSLGSPDYPDAAATEAVRRAGALTRIESDRHCNVINGELIVELEMPLSSVSCLELMPDALD